MKCYTATLTVSGSNPPVSLSVRPHIAITKKENENYLYLGEHYMSKKAMHIPLSKSFSESVTEPVRKNFETGRLSDFTLQTDRRGKLTIEPDYASGLKHPLHVLRVVLLECVGSTTNWWQLQCPPESKLSSGIDSQYGFQKESTLLLLKGHQIVHVEGNNFMSGEPPWELCLGFLFEDFNSEPQLGDFGDAAQFWTVPDSWSIA